MKLIHPHLPIFLSNRQDSGILYTPGHLTMVSPRQGETLQRHWENKQPNPAGRLNLLKTQIETKAQEVVEAWLRQQEKSFQPLCLLVYLSHSCNLNCSYCFAKFTDKTDHQPVIDPNAVLAAAQIVARHAAQKNQNFRLVLHGGGEPTIHWGLVQHLVTLTRQVAAEHRVDWWGYIATNGMLSADRARWVARNFDLVGLSCDGPPDIQDRQRPRSNGTGSSRIVERTAHILAQAGRLSVRTTITPLTVARQEEIITYLHSRLGATLVRFEPLYRVRGRGEDGFSIEAAEYYVRHFLAAQHQARARGVELMYSGVRLDELHGPNCDVSRDVLHLTPDGAVTTCFFCIDGRSQTNRRLLAGRWHPDTGYLHLDWGKLQAHRRQALTISGRCRLCLNAYHCARECPEICWVDDSRQTEASQPPPSFWCLMQRQLAEAWIEQATASLTPAPAPVLGEETRDESLLEGYLSEAPPWLDVEAVLRHWRSARRHYNLDSHSLPQPVWAQRPFEHDGQKAVQQFQEDFPSRDQTKAISVYLHVPFCDRKCPFCDCYSVPMGKHRQREVPFMEAMLRELDFWSSLHDLCYRQVTTVHLGGGTPNFLQSSILDAIIEKIKACLNTTPGTEWALESTASLLVENQVEHLAELGFKRWHVGVQTLEDPIRRLLGRREPAVRVLEKLARLLEKGLVVSVDLVLGLPGQTPADFCQTLESLVGLGVHGFSFYRLQQSNRNKSFFQRHQAQLKNSRWSYLLFQAAEQYLLNRSYRKVFFNHYARPEDAYLYYTSPQRGEDLLALGPTSDGAFGNYLYRHPELLAYLTGARQPVPVLEGGLWESDLEIAVQPIIRELMSANLTRHSLAVLELVPLLESWLNCGLVQESLNSSQYQLTATGSWLINQMLDQVKSSLRGA